MCLSLCTTMIQHLEVLFRGLLWQGFTVYINVFCVCTYVYLPSCSIQGLSYTNVVLSPYLYYFSFAFCWCIFFAIITFSFSPFQVSILLREKTVLFCIVQTNFSNFLLFPLKYLAFPFLLNIRSFLFISSKCSLIFIL